ncbi:MAG: hypothetical protein JWM10_744 [Myxococcaceae bacterium]|nr:hypothetical protein [Myxococcaceae bacterium]
MLTPLGLGDEGGVVADVVPHEGERLARVTLGELMETERHGMDGPAPVERSLHVALDPRHDAAGEFWEETPRDLVPELALPRTSSRCTQHAAGGVDGTRHDADPGPAKVPTNFREHVPLGRPRLRRNAEDDEGGTEATERAADASDEALDPGAPRLGMVKIEDAEAPWGEPPPIQRDVASVVEIENEDEEAGRISE